MSDSNLAAKTTKRDDMTLLVRNFNFPLPNALKSPTVPFKSFEPVNSIASSTNNYDTRDETEGAWSTNDSSAETNKKPENNIKERIKPFVDFGEYFQKFEEFEKEGTLPEFLKKKSN